MSVLLKILSGLRCAALIAEDSPSATSLLRQVSSQLPVSYPPQPLTAVQCPLLLLYYSPEGVQVPVFRAPPCPAHRVILVTWKHPHPDHLYMISSHFSGITFLWISGFGSPEENYWTFNEENPNQLRVINGTLAGNLFQVKKLEKLPNFKGKILHVAANNYTIYSLLLNPDEHGHFKHASGFELEILYQLCSALGLRPVVSTMAGWDIYHKNGTLKTPGLLAEVTSGRVDAGLGGIWYRPSMVGEVGVLAPWDQGCYRYLVPRPEIVFFDWNLFLEMFTICVWLLTVCFIVVVAVLLTLFAKLSPNWNHQKEGDSLCSNLFLVSCILIQVPSVRWYWSGPQVAILYGWVWAVLILFAAFSGSLSAILIHPELNDKIDTVEEYLERGYTYGSIHLPNENTGLIFDDEESGISLEWKYGRFVLENSLQDRIDRMKTKTYVVPGESHDKFFYFLQAPIPPYEVIQQYEVADNCHQWFYSVQIFPIWSEYSAALNLVASRLRAGGLISFISKNCLQYDPLLSQFLAHSVFSTTSESLTNYSPITFGSLSGMFGILILGLFLAFCCFAVELILGAKSKPHLPA